MATAQDRIVMMDNGRLSALYRQALLTALAAAVLNEFRVIRLETLGELVGILEACTQEVVARGGIPDPKTGTVTW
jgi:hypothetical protein